jgi:hypothetical protein
MSVAAFCRVVRSQWQALAEYVWPATPDQRLQAEVFRRTRELARRYRRLVTRRRKIEALRDRLAQQERELLADPLSPEHLPLARQRNARRLAEHEERYVRERWAYLRCKQLRLALLRGQVTVCDPPTASW